MDLITSVPMPIPSSAPPPPSPSSASPAALPPPSSGIEKLVTTDRKSKRGTLLQIQSDTISAAKAALNPVRINILPQKQKQKKKVLQMESDVLNYKAPKVLGDIVESIAGSIFLDSGRDTGVVWQVFQPLFDPMVTPETLPMHPVRELQERCQQQAEGLEYKATRSGNLATVEVYIDGIQVGTAQNQQKKMAQKLAARNALVALKEKETAEANKEKRDEDEKKNSGTQTFTRQTLNDICLRRNWPMPLYRCVNESGPAHAKRFTFAVRVNTSDRGWTDECVGEPMPSVKKAKDSAAVLLLELLNNWYA